MSYAFDSIYFDTDIVEGRVLDIFRPSRRRRDTALFFVHGGGWRNGSRTVWHRIMRALNREGFVCASTDYRMSGVTIQEQIQDVREGYGCFRCALGSTGRPCKVAVIGSSAGAHLAALLALTRPTECGEIAPSRRRCAFLYAPPAAAILVSCPTTFEPWPDIFPPSLQAMQDIVGTSYGNDPEAFRRVSPINWVRTGVAPILLLDGECEHMFPLEQKRRFVETMRSVGARAEHRVYSRAEHGFFYDVVRRQQREAFDDILRFLAGIERQPRDGTSDGTSGRRRERAPDTEHGRST